MPSAKEPSDHSRTGELAVSGAISQRFDVPARPRCRFQKPFFGWRIGTSSTVLSVLRIYALSFSAGLIMKSRRLTINGQRPE